MSQELLSHNRVQQTNKFPNLSFQSSPCPSVESYLAASKYTIARVRPSVECKSLTFAMSHRSPFCHLMALATDQALGLRATCTGNIMNGAVLLVLVSSG